MIKTDRLILKDHSINNLAKLHKWFNDEEISYYDDEDFFTHQDLEETQQYLENRLLQCGFNAKKNILHIAIHTHNNTLIGYCMIAFIDRYNNKCKIGLTIGEKSEWGKGYGKEVVKALIEYCFLNLRLNRISAEIFSINKASIHLFENLGFNREGIIRQSVIKDNKYIDEYVYGLLRDEWETNKDFLKSD